MRGRSRRPEATHALIFGILGSLILAYLAVLAVAAASFRRWEPNEQNRMSAPNMRNPALMTR